MELEAVKKFLTDIPVPALVFLAFIIIVFRQNISVYIPRIAMVVLGKKMERYKSRKRFVGNRL
ncbi:MAG: hypothetical protein GY749_02880 [Desulfobacteraceae bacterium]|nr:hypothetical protein [Desulfobacteraceae bacterium]